VNSLRRQLQLGLALGLALLLGILWWASGIAVSSLTDQYVVSRLEHDAESLLAALHPDGAGSFAVRPNRINAIYHQPFSGHYYQLEFADGRRLFSRSLWDRELAIPQFTPGSAGHWRQDGPDGQSLLVRVAGYAKEGSVFTLALAEDITPLQQRLVIFHWSFAALALLITLLLLATQYQIVKRALKHLDPVKADIRRLEQGEITRLVSEVPEEIRPLVEEFNHLLGLLQQRLTQSRNSLGNLSHALKGPLTLLLQQIESEELADHPVLRQAMQRQAERIRQLMERELKRVRVSGNSLGVKLFDAAQELPDLVSVLEQMYAGKSVRIETILPVEPQLMVEREDMLELLGNLLDNACKWAKGRVRCEIRQNGQVIVDIEDDGEGISPGRLERLAERGVRLDESVDGHGLGLAIASDIVDRYGGEIRFGHAAHLGGLHVGVRLPLPREG
jgi:signal transduction histidine kinase